jgi:four helix bundle protein
MKNSVLRNKSYAFALRIVKLRKYLQNEKREFDLSRQLLRSGTAIAALVRESEYVQSKADFSNKLHIALKEANETAYWLELLKDSEFISKKMYESIEPEVDELIRLLVSSIKTTKGDKSSENNS